MPRERPRILIVDDDPVTCELLCEVFEREGFAARSEQSGEAALASLDGDGPNVILSDIRMKTRTGAESPQPSDDLADLFVGLPTIDDIERRYLLRVLEATGGNRKRAAEILGINRRTLYRMAARFRIDLEDRKPTGD